MIMQTCNCFLPDRRQCQLMGFPHGCYHRRTVKRHLQAGAPIMHVPSVDQIALQRILVQSALRLGIQVRR